MSTTGCSHSPLCAADGGTAGTIVSLIEVIRQPVEMPVHVGSGTGGRLQGFLPGQFSSSSVEQNVDFPVPHGRDRVGGGFLGFHPGQSSTAFGGAQHFPTATAEQIVDIPVPHPASSSSGLPGTQGGGRFSPGTEFNRCRADR